MFRYAFWMVSLLLLFNACNHPNSISNSGDVFTGSNEPSVKGNASEVIYSLTLPTDISRIFEETGTFFNPELLMPLDRIPLYENPGQMALLIGALGVDLSYCKIFGRVFESAENYKHIELLADKLGLPGEIFEKSAADLEQFVSEPDSLTELINQLYREVDSYFKENNQESLASLSLLGGWLETMYIGVNIYQEKTILEMGDRILQQKYALTSLVCLLGNYQESLVVRRYMHPLIKLKEAYEQVEIRYSQDGFQMNQEERMFHASVSEITYEPETLDNICQMILQIRKEIIQ
ncbi:MAG: hypothetical protein KAR19_05805 [Bacteroidales bacterium]|nr:hypothetical protein [Bacteroidales bacterium]